MSKLELSAPRFASAEFVAHTMSSREIAELTGKEHKNVKADILNMLGQLGKDALSFERIYLDSMNRQQTQYYLTGDLTETLITGYSIPLRHKVILRLRELEAQVVTPQPVTHLDTARMLVASLEIQAEQAALLAIAAPKAAFVDRYVEASGSMSFRQVSKLIWANERQFRQMLLDKDVMYYLGGVLTPYKPHQDAGRFEVKTGTSEHNGHAFSQARFTAKGVQWVAGLWAARQLEVSND